MASVSSFRDVIANMYYNDLFDELSEYIEDNPDKLESNSYHVQSPDEAALSGRCPLQHLLHCLL